jgi:hypothetical protein
MPSPISIKILKNTEKKTSVAKFASAIPKARVKITHCTFGGEDVSVRRTTSFQEFFASPTSVAHSQFAKELHKIMP